MKIILGLCCFSIMLFFQSCNKDQKNYYTLPSSNGEGNSFNVVIEIPAGTNKKFEYNKSSNTFEIDKKDGKERIIQFLPYIGNYGFVPSTLSDSEKGGDGDALDVLVLSENVLTGTVQEVFPVAMLKLIDDGELDYKIIAVPVNHKSRIINVESFKELQTKFPEVVKIIELWFINYNKAEKALINGWSDEKEAIKEIYNSRIK